MMYNKSKCFFLFMWVWFQRLVLIAILNYFKTGVGHYLNKEAMGRILLLVSFSYADSSSSNFALNFMDTSSRPRIS